MKIHIEFDDGQQVTMSPEELGSSLTYSIINHAAKQLAGTAPPKAPPRCPLCQFGRVGNGYCACALGRDLKRVERSKVLQAEKASTDETPASAPGVAPGPVGGSYDRNL